MRHLLVAALAAAVLAGAARAEEKAKQAPKIVLKSPDGKKSYDLAKLTAEGPVLVRLTCACSGCDQELPFFQKKESVEGITLEDHDKYPLLKARLRAFRHCYGQPPEVRRAFEHAMGIAK